MSQHANHLTEAQFEAYAAQCRDLRFDAETHRTAGHISACSDCLDRFLQVYQSNLSFPQKPAARTANCLSDDDLRRLAAGICPAETAGSALQHVPLCNHCGPLLRQFMEDFREELSAEDKALLSRTRSATAPWQREMAKEMMQMQAGSGEASRGKIRAWFSWPPKIWVPAAAALAAVLAVGVGFGVWPMIVEINARQTSQEAFSESGKRVIEMRLPSVKYAPYEPLPVVMGESSQDSIRKGPALYEAEAAVEKTRRAGKMDANWRQIDARTALLEGTAGSATRAVDTFEKARTEGGNSAALQIELAAAYFERDSRADKPNLAKTIDLLEGVLAMPNVSRQDRAVALFNVAVAYEKINAWQLVADRLDEYLKLEPSGPWAQEATARRDAAKAKLPPPRPQGYKTPSFFFFIGLIPASSSR